MDRKTTHSGQTFIIERKEEAYNIVMHLANDGVVTHYPMNNIHVHACTLITLS